VFFYLSKLLFPGFLQFKGNFVHGHNTITKLVKVICFSMIKPSLWWRANAPFWYFSRQLFNSLRWPIYNFNLVDITKLPSLWWLCDSSQAVIVESFHGKPVKGSLRTVSNKEPLILYCDLKYSPQNWCKKKIINCVDWSYSDWLLSNNYE